MSVVIDEAHFSRLLERFKLNGIRSRHVYCRIEMHKVADQNVTMLQTDKVTKLQT